MSDVPASMGPRLSREPRKGQIAPMRPRYGNRFNGAAAPVEPRKGIIDEEVGASRPLLQWGRAQLSARKERMEGWKELDNGGAQWGRAQVERRGRGGAATPLPLFWNSGFNRGPRLSRARKGITVGGRQ